MERKRRVRAIWGLAGAVLAVAAIVVPLLVLAGSGQATLTAETYADVIRFGVQGAGTLEIQIYDLSEKVLWDSGVISSDFVDWDRTDTWGERLANGYYMYLAQAWDMSGSLILSKTGKVALLPGDQVQLQAAPAVQNPGATSGTFPIPESPLQTMGLGDTGVFNIVGIGTASPSSKLHIYASWPEIKLEDPGTGSPQMSFYSGGTLGGFFQYRQTANSFRFGNYKAGGDVRLLSGGNNERMTITGTGNVGIGTTSPLSTLAVAGPIRTTGAEYYPDLRSGTGDLDLMAAGDVWLIPQDNAAVVAYEDLQVYDTSEPWIAVTCDSGSGRTYGFESSNDGFFEVWDWNYGDYIAWWGPAQGFWVRGNLSCGGTKSFIIPHPDQPGKEIEYTSLEGPEVGIYVRGSTVLGGGRATITLPEYFAAIAVGDSITVQLTPRGTWLQLYVVSATGKEIVVREAEGRSGQFDYLVQGIRQGYEDFQPVRDAGVGSPSSSHESTPPQGAAATRAAAGGKVAAGEKAAAEGSE